MKYATNLPMPIHRLARSLAVCGLLVVTAAGDRGRAAPLMIANETLVVTCDEAAGSFAVAEKPGGNGLHHKRNFLAVIIKRKVRS